MNLLGNFCKSLDDHWRPEAVWEAPHFYKSLCSCCDKIAALLPGSEMAEVSHVFGSYHEVMQAKKRLDEALGAEQKDANDILQCVSNLERRALSVDKAVDCEVKLLEHDCFSSKLSAMRSSASKIVEMHQGKLADDAHAKLFEAVKQLGTVSQGAPDGADWLAGFEGINFEALMEHAQQTLLEMNSKDLVEGQDNVTKAGVL